MTMVGTNDARPRRDQKNNGEQGGAPERAIRAISDGKVTRARPVTLDVRFENGALILQTRHCLSRSQRTAFHYAPDCGNLCVSAVSRLPDP